MVWIPVGAWIAAVVIAAVLLGFCAYEIHWKSTRLQRDMARLNALNGDLAQLRSGLAAAQQRVAAARGMR